MLIRSEQSSLTNIDRSLKKLQDIKWNLVCQTGLLKFFFIEKSRVAQNQKHWDTKSWKKSPPKMQMMIKLRYNWLKMFKMVFVRLSLRNFFFILFSQNII